jgi:formiminoglutamate deiminase
VIAESDRARKTTIWFATALLPRGWAQRVRVEISNGRIAAVTTDTDPAPEDERAAIGLPGMPNLHSHAFQRAMAGLAERRGSEGDSFWTWREAMYRFVDRLGPEELEAIAAFAYVEMLEAGFTRVGEFHYLHHAPDGRPYADLAEMSSRIAAAASTAGIGLTLLPVFYAHGGFGGAPPDPGQRRFLNDVERFARLLDGARTAVAKLGDARVGVAPHSLRAVTPEELDAIAQLADGAPVHIHAAEQVREVEECLAALGARPVEWLLDHAPVDARWCLVHATHMTSGETMRLAQSGAVAGLCPITEANLGDGIFNAAEYLRAGGAFGIGSDSNVRIDLAEELRLLEYGQRLARRERNVLADHGGRSTGRMLFEHALEGGARALGVECGIRIGASADLIALDANHPSLIERDGDGLLDGWIFAAAGTAIDRVWRGGSRVVAAGRHVRRATVTARYREALRRALDR